MVVNAETSLRYRGDHEQDENSPHPVMGEALPHFRQEESRKPARMAKERLGRPVRRGGIGVHRVQRAHARSLRECRSRHPVSYTHLDVYKRQNPSYEYADHQYLYALWSQGFRRGGANSVPEAGIFQESPLLRTYAPDETNNYEAGLKGRFDNGLSYTFAVFDIRWSKPQIFASLPSGNLAVYNANTAESKGFEVQSSGPLFLPGLGYSVGISYADAKLTSDFSLPANNGAGVITPGELTGTAGEQLPGSPKTSVDATLSYAFSMPSDYELTTALNANYRTPIKFALAPTLGATAVSESSSFQTLNYSAVLKMCIRDSAAAADFAGCFFSVGP